MSTADSTTEPALRFKRRKVANAKRTPLVDEHTTPSQDATDGPTPADVDLPQRAQVEDDDANAPNLREILRGRKRPRDRMREATRKPEAIQTQALIAVETPKQDLYSSRFVAQTGQVVDRDDKQMSEYIEARLAEKNQRLYGWPIPKHLEAAVAILAPEVEPSALSNRRATPAASPPSGPVEPGATVSTDHSQRLAAGMGKLQEVDLGPSAAARNIERTRAARKKLEGVDVEIEAAPKVRLGKNGKPRRQPKRRNSEDLRRDQLVEAVLREAKLEYFEEDKAQNTTSTGDADNDDAMVEKFRQEFLESIESRQQRKAAPPPGAKGVKEPPKGPKLGGSRSARAAMRLQEEQAAKNKR